MPPSSTDQPTIRQLFEHAEILTLRNALIIAPVLYILFRLIYALFLSPCRKIPGPFLARITGLWEAKKVVEGDSHKAIIKLHEQYGPVVRIAPNRYDFDTLEATKIIYRIGNAFPKSKYYVPFGSPHGPNVLNALENELHATMKRQLASLYSMSTLLSYEATVDSQTAIMRQKLDSFAATGELVNLPAFFQYYAFDVVGMITLGSSMGMMEANADTSGICAALDTAFDYASVAGLFPALHPWLMSLMGVLRVPSPTLGLDNFVEEKMELHMDEAAQADGSKKSATFLSKMVALKNQGKATKHDIRVCMTTNISAGSDTTAISLSAIVYYLWTNPRVLERLRQELDAQSKAGRLSDMPTYHEAQEIPYLLAVIKEALRLHSAVGTQLTRVVPKGGCVIEGHYFPEGAEVGVNGWALHYNKEMFGKDVHEFRPERWLEGDKTNIGLPESFAFGQGSRSCLGKNISILEMSKVIPQVVQNFDIDISPNAQAWSGNCRWFVKPEYKARLRHRTKSGK
ncbi:hypothetical protein COCC4DRAFT_44371 [Bipolaris maydis ATCC 48331]|uniref:Pisatin demethylase n=2 Tax=Cochliobolus heterostrophus TaxID=5016 RepID=M2UP50_COCH5|nr:uncharacterized protein COCC4DRAFT_44371 [Bipolaris maydis ATCC 48331]EMD95336.1 hypothetical protein COCHEDRAFT_1092452 [Bipolaris maydis C5]KAJ5021943.1 cytochrome P450 [Bipolaris maydis]ENI00483.1 hypothetical protein COCC4DRAFT_44371 [Bipolaris maydis ATCC 48331]KAJ5055113.1 cytochrome P450 [Bipolaris maydis]KAJ6202987.1 cytochrome P450 [Bipolaris maydis]